MVARVRFGRCVAQARQTLHAVGSSLVAAWQEAQSTVKPTGSVAVAIDSPEGGVQGFLGQLLQSRSEAGGTGLTDAQVCATTSSWMQRLYIFFDMYILLCILCVYTSHTLCDTTGM